MATEVPGLTIKASVKPKKARARAPVRIETPCPSCGHRTLFIGSGGHLTCSWLQCQEPGVEHKLFQLRDTAKTHEHVMQRLNGQRFYLTSVQNMRTMHRAALGDVGELKLLDAAMAATADVLAQLTDEPERKRGILVQMETAPGVEPDAGVQIGPDIGKLPPVAGTRTVTVTRG